MFVNDVLSCHVNDVLLCHVNDVLSCHVNDVLSCHVNDVLSCHVNDVLSCHAIANMQIMIITQLKTNITCKRRQYVLQHFCNTFCKLLHAYLQRSTL